GQRAGMARGSSCPCEALPGLERDDRLLASLRCRDEAPAVPEGLGEEADLMRGRVRLQPVQRVSLGDVDAVADRQEASDAQTATGGTGEDHAAEGAALADHADAAHKARRLPEVAAVEPATRGGGWGRALAAADDAHAVRADEPHTG